MDIIDDIFKFKTFDHKKLINFGFILQGGIYTYSKPILNDQFILVVKICGNKIDFDVFDIATNDLYTLIKVKDATGSFVGKMRLEIEEFFIDVATRCAQMEIFKNPQTKRLIAYAKNKYGDDVEHLWAKTPENAVLRRKETNKWYGAILSCKCKSLGLAGDSIIEILDFRMNPEKLAKTIDNKIYFAGYHMNKKHWCSIILDDSLSDNIIFDLLADSYALAK